MVTAMNTKPDDPPGEKRPPKKQKLTAELLREEIARRMNMPPNAKDLIVVCSRCLRSSCWAGIRHCKNHRSAGVVWKNVAELKELKREPSRYWHTASEWAEIREADRKRKTERPVILYFLLHWSLARIVVCLISLVIIVDLAPKMPLPVACVFVPLFAIYVLTMGSRWD